MQNKIGVGIIGANPDRSWAAMAHIPALQALDSYEIVALSTSRRESADAAGERFGVPLAFDNHAELLALPQVDLVVVSVKVPAHRELVGAALDAGKMVYCEWPLGASLDEAESMAAQATAVGARTTVGLQARGAPEINYVRDLVRDGFAGDVLSTTLVVSAMVGTTIDAANAYLADVRTAANLLTITTGHCLDTLAYCLGEFIELSAGLHTRQSTVEVAQTGEIIERTSPDHVAVIGELASGATAALHVRGGLGNGAEFTWHINGTAGDLRVEVAGTTPGIAPTRVVGAKHGAPMGEMAVPDSYVNWISSARGPERGALSVGGYNVAVAYDRFAADLNDGTNLSPTFADAVLRHRTIAAIQRSSQTGVRQLLAKPE